MTDDASVKLANALEYDISLAQQHLSLLDEEADAFTFQVFDDNKARAAAHRKANPNSKGDFKYTRVLNGSIEKQWPQLVEFNRLGSGIFVTVNRTDLSGRQLKNIKDIRCVFHELDQAAVKADPIEPSFIVQSSKGKAHKYWLCDELSKDDFKSIQARMVNDYGSDRNATDNSRVLRLSGFYHMKDSMNPQLVQVIHESGGLPYTHDALIKAFPLDVKKTSAVNGVNVAGVTGGANGVGQVSVGQEVISDLESALLYISSDDREQWVAIGHALHELGEVGKGLWVNWSAKSVNYDPDDIHGRWDGFKPVATGYKSIFSKAQSVGWVNSATLRAQDRSTHNNSNGSAGVSGDNDDSESGALKSTLSSSKFDSHNDILDSSGHSCKVNFMDSINDDHILKKLSINLANVCDIPVHTVFLMGLGIVSSVACRRFSVAYKDGGALPLGLYAVGEQPPGIGKSRCLNTFQKPFSDAINFIKKDIEAEIKEIKKGIIDGETKHKINALYESIPTPIFTTNTTPEALEQSLIHTNGYFSAVSSEQDLFDSLIGGLYSSGGGNNNGIILNGYDGGNVSNMRIGRESYSGSVAGSVVLFAQMNSIEKVLDSSNGTGLSERFLLISEKHMLGKRDFLVEKEKDEKLIDEYNIICSNIITPILDNGAESLDSLMPICISNEGHHEIALFRNSIEPFLDDGEKYSHSSIRGAAAKINIQVMKIASILYLMDNDGNRCILNMISKETILTAIHIAKELLYANVRLHADKGINGQKAEYVSILSLFKNDNRPRTERNIIQVKSCTSPFKEFTGNKSKLVRDTLALMINDGVLVMYIQEKAKMYSMAQ